MSHDAFKHRTFQYGIRCVRLVESLPKTMIAQTIGKQLLRSATSVGANYRAAVRSRSRTEFIAKMGIVEEECDETLYWIDVLNELGLLKEKSSDALYKEGSEILAVTVSSIKTAKRNSPGTRSREPRTHSSL